MEDGLEMKMWNLILMKKIRMIPNSSPSSEQNRTRPIIITIEHAGLRYLIVNGLGVSRFSSIVQRSHDSVVQSVNT
ncbi:hypothetical protein NC651_022626 [Populus alba x Populus x berolinensis]|nr:hypothetical protein NC651_022626 [Populus alba x Populus x berolinensis]